MAVAIRNLETLGSEIQGLDLSRPLAPEDCEAITDALNRQLVVVARNQRLSDSALLAFSRNFGDLDPPGPNPYGEPFNKECPEINVISNVTENGRPIGGLGAGEAVWHADMTYIDVPPKAAVLHALEIPPRAAATPTSPTCSPPKPLCPPLSSKRSRARLPCMMPRATAPGNCARDIRR
jgi:taurine dioxygenase